MSVEGPEQSRQVQEYRRGPIARFLSIFGILFPRRRGQCVHLTRRFCFIVLAGVLAVLAAVALFLLHLSNRPQFCTSCHIMEKYVQSWRTSSHRNVNCDQCHYPPGWRNVLRAKIASTTHLIKTLTGTEGWKPHAEISDDACLREGCHETRLLEGKVVFKGRYRFDHGPHLTRLRRGMKLRCTTCHSQIVQGSHITVTENVCFTCHFAGKIRGQVPEPVAGCTSCHDAPAKAIETSTGITFRHKPFLDRKVPCWKCHSDSVQGRGEVPRRLCVSCHSEPEKLDKFADRRHMHDWHVTRRKVECFRCHGEIRHGLRPPPRESKGLCATCHGADHSLQEQMLAGRGGRGVEDSPDRHFLANVDCVACHDVPRPATGNDGNGIGAHKATERACVGCHGEAFRGKLAEWRSALGEILEEAKDELAKAGKAYSALGADDPRKAKIQALLEVARRNCRFVAAANGVHNFNYALDLLDHASQSATLAAEEAQQKAPRDRNLDKTPRSVRARPRSPDADRGRHVQRPRATRKTKK